MNLDPDFILHNKQRTKCSFMTDSHWRTIQSLHTGNSTGQNSVLMQWTSVCRQYRFGRQEGWNIHHLLSFDNEATWQWSHFQMSEVHTSKRKLTLHNFCLFHSALKCQSKVGTQNSTAQLNERLVNGCDKSTALEKGSPAKKKKKHIVCKYEESSLWMFNFLAM